METRDRHRLERHARRIEKLRLRRNAREHPIPDWLFAIGDGKPQGLRLGDFWPEVGTPAWITTETAVKPREWDAWDVDEDHELDGEKVYGHAGAFGETEEGLRATVEYERNRRGSRIRQSYRLHAGSRRLDVATSVEWHEREVFLRALFPLNVRAPRATFETMYGAQERLTHRNTSWDAARFEVSANRFWTASTSYSCTPSATSMTSTAQRTATASSTLPSRPGTKVSSGPSASRATATRRPPRTSKPSDATRSTPCSPPGTTCPAGTRATGGTTRRW